MDYIFGTVARNRRMVENLKIINTSHTDLKDFQQVIREYPDCVITDNFRVVEKYHEAEGMDGMAYDWYIIDCHYRTIDKTKPIVQKQEQQRADIDFISLMTGVDLV